jgi:hypothetical protein
VDADDEDRPSEVLDAEFMAACRAAIDAADEAR